MIFYPQKLTDNKITSPANEDPKGLKKNVTTAFVDNRPEAIAQRKFQQLVNDSALSEKTVRLQGLSNEVVRQLPAKTIAQGVFLALDTGLALEFKQKHSKLINSINEKIAVFLKNKALQNTWLEGFPEALKLDWISYLLNQDESTQQQSVIALCTGLAGIPFDPLKPPPYTIDTLRVLMKMKTDLLPDPSSTKVSPIDVVTEIYELVIVDIKGKEIKREKMVSPIFRKITNNKFCFIKVQLPESTTEDTFKKIITFQNKNYRIDMLAGSSLKSTINSQGSVYGVEVESVGLLKNFLGFEESSYYAQRALFPLVVGGVDGQIRGRTLPVGDKDEKTFYLKNGTPIQIEDGWGYIVQSLADKMQEGGLSREKRTPSEESGRASYQMYEWLDTENFEIVNELVNDGLQAWDKFFQSNQHLGYANTVTHDGILNTTTKDIEKIKTLHSILTTGKPAMESGVSMPVSGNKFVVPQNTRYTSKTKGQGASIVRSPADKQNFYPVPAQDIDQSSKQSKFVSDIEGIQYTLTGRDNGVLTFFKGMLGIIPDSQWPDTWEGLDMIVTSKDRKLYEHWVKDSSLQGKEKTDTPQNDRATAHKSIQDFLIQGSLVATQWFKKGSFIGVPNEMQKWLGGDYDGDEIGMVFDSHNPMLNKQVGKVFEQEEVNPKLIKTFTHNPHSTRSKRLVDMRSSNVGLWSSLAAQVKSLTIEQYSTLAKQTAKDRLLPKDSNIDNLPEGTRMIKEIQLGMKVGTDGYKTAVSAMDFENRAKQYQLFIKKMNRRPLQHDKKLQKIISEVGLYPTLQIPAWRNIYFGYDTVDKKTGEYQVKGLSPRVLQRMIRHLLPSEDLWYEEKYYEIWKDSEGFDPSNTLVRSKDYFCELIDEYNREIKGATAIHIRIAVWNHPVSTYEHFEAAFLYIASQYWYQYNSRTYYLYIKKNSVWMAKLRNLLKKYYAQSI